MWQRRSLRRAVVDGSLVVAVLAAGGVTYAVVGIGWGPDARDPAAALEPRPSADDVSDVTGAHGPASTVPALPQASLTEATLPPPTVAPKRPAGIPATCPLTGLRARSPSGAARDALLVQIENNPDARPTSNLVAADLIIEAPVEGDTTRFSGVFQCGDAPGLTGPIRSARYYNVDLFQMMRTVTVGYGASPIAEQRFAAAAMPYVNGVYGHLDGVVFFRASHRVAPHNVYADMGVVRAALESGTHGMTGFSAAAGELRPPFAFDPSATVGGGRPVQNLTIWTNSFWSFGWHYDPEAGSFRRSDAGVVQVDEITGEPFTRDTIVLQIVTQSTVFDDPDPGGYPRREQHLVASGPGLLLVGGQAFDLGWARNAATDPTTWTVTATGEPLVLPPGSVYWGIIPDTSTIIAE